MAVILIPAALAGCFAAWCLSQAFVTLADPFYAGEEETHL